MNFDVIGKMLRVPGKILLMTQLTPKQRRAECNPVLIGAVVGTVAPLTSIIWGVRQRSWSLALVPTAVVAISIGLVAGTNMTKLEKYSFQLAGGLVAGVIANSLKKEQMDQ
jgi:hypothetical protein